MVSVAKRFNRKIGRKYQVNRINPHVAVKECRNGDGVGREAGHPSHVLRELCFQGVGKYPERLLQWHVSSTQHRAHPICGFGAASSSSKSSVSKNGHPI